MASSIKILLVDDDIQARIIWSAVATKLGLVTLQASDGARAWAMLQDNPDIRLVVTDYQMPNLDGRQLVGVMQQCAKTQELPVIMVSGVIPASEVRDLIGLGVSRFVTKGESLDVMSKYIEILLGLPNKLQIAA